MNSRRISLTLMVGLCSCPMAPAQQSAQPGQELFLQQFTGSVVNAKDIWGDVEWEEVEIFRRILERSLQGWAERSYPRTNLGNLAFSPDGSYLAASPADGTAEFWDVTVGKRLLGSLHGGHSPSVEGNYLRGYGVVFTATLPWSGPVVEPSKPVPHSLTEWDRVRKEIRGEKVELKPSPPQRGSSLAAVVLKVLAENGWHFSQVGQSDRVTVAITLRPASAAPLATFRGNTPMGRGAMPALPGGIFDPMNSPNNVTGIGEAAALPNTTAQNLFQFVLSNNQTRATKQAHGQAAASQKAEAANLIHLGELRQKEGRNSEAAEAYQKAIAACEKLLELKKQPGNSIQDFIAALNMAGDARSKLAQVYYAQGKRDEAIRALEQIAKEYAAVTQKATPKAEPTPPKEAKLGKLIISAPKNLLNQVGTGKLSMDEFKKQVTIDYWAFPLKGSSEPMGSTSSTPAERKK